VWWGADAPHHNTPRTSRHYATNGRYLPLMKQRHSIFLRTRGIVLGVCTVLLIATAGLPQLAAAQGGAALMDPASTLHHGTLGESISATVSVRNPGATSLNLRLYLSDWSFDPAGQFIFADAGTLERSASNWLSVEAPTLELGPNETALLPYTIAVPTDAEPGTHWAVIFAETEPTDPEPGQAAASISVRVGHIVYVNVPSLESSGAIVGMFGSPPTSSTGAYTVIAQYANTGNAAQGVEGTFTLRDEQGQNVIEAQIERSVVLPGVDRAFQINVVGPLPAGNYTALVVLNYGSDEQDVAGAIDFTLTEPLLERGTPEQGTSVP